MTLGRGEAERRGIAPKAALLDRAAVAGLPVPPGFIVPDGAPAPAARTVDTWCRSTGTSSLAVRSAFGAEDGTTASLAGWFRTVLRVDADRVQAAIDDVRASGDDRTSQPIVGGGFRRDVLVMAMVEARVSGVAFSEPGTYDDVVNVTTGTAERLVDGTDGGDRLLLPRLERAEPGWARRLQLVLRAVRREFGDQPWDVEWADDGRRCWLIQVRPITAPTPRDEILTIANHAEILPPLPSPFMTSLIAEAGPDLFDWYRRIDDELPANRQFLHIVAGRPFLNLSLMEDVLRHLGLPTGLVAGSLGGPPAVDRPLNPRRLATRVPALARFGWAQVWAVIDAPRREEHAAAIGTDPAPSMAAAIDDLGRAYVHLVTGMFPLASAMGPPLALLRAAGALAGHAGRHRTITTEMAEAIAAARAAAGTPAAPARRADVLSRFGHRGIYESDIARPRYRDEPGLAFGTAPDEPTTDGEGRERTASTGARPAADPLGWRGWLTTPLWLLAARPLAARERLRHRAMEGFAAIRTSLVELARNAVDAGQLRRPDDLWLLSVEEARDLDDGWHPTPAFWTEREAEVAALAALDPPALVHLFDDPGDWGPSSDGGRAATIRGLPLTTGTVRGRAWVLDQPTDRLPPGFEPSTTILVARSIDAGWIPTMTQVAGVVAEIGGDLSHGSILVREQRLPAITNAAGATRAIQTGDEVELRAGPGVLRSLAGPDEAHLAP